MPMKNPPHPGGVVLRQCIEPLGLTITRAAAALGVTWVIFLFRTISFRCFKSAYRTCHSLARPAPASLL